MGKVKLVVIFGAMISLMVGGNIQAEEISVPYPFSPGTTISSSEMNENFKIVYDKINEILSKLGSVETRLARLRFVDNDDGTITDNEHNLIFLKNPDCFDVMDWDAAISAASNLANGTCDLVDNSMVGDWRLPTKDELSLLKEWQESGIFTVLTGDKFYWSSTTYAGSDSRHPSPNSAWHVNVGDGQVIYAYKSRSEYVWMVRTKQ